MISQILYHISIQNRYHKICLLNRQFDWYEKRKKSKGCVRTKNHPKENLNLKREHFMEMHTVKAAHPNHHQKL